MPTVLVTGASGFAGRPLCALLAKRGYKVVAASRSVPKWDGFEKCMVSIVGDIVNSHSDVWRSALVGVDTVIHLAACVHRKSKTIGKEVFRRVNTEATAKLCRLAVESGIRRFIFISTAKVNGENSVRPFSEHDLASPQDYYAQSKWEAEKQIASITRGSKCDFIILRPPLVYGPGVRANFLSLLKIVSANIPLPLGSLHNRRSMIYVGNLADAVLAAVESPRAAGQVFMVSDGHDLTVTELIKALAGAMGQKPKLFPFPVGWLQGIFRRIGQGDRVDKLCEPLVVDSSRIKDVVGWEPPYTVREGIDATVAWFKTRSIGIVRR